jgi:trk system potassium uptake protein TrkH
MGLMFVGGCPGGTSGGVKVTTLALLLLAVRSLLRDEYDIQVSSRTVPRHIVIRALVVVVLSGVVVFLGFLTLLVTQSHLPFIALGFEAVSAFGTVGLSLGVTDKLDSTGMFVIMMLMFVGRIGPLSVAYGVGRSKKLPWKGAMEEIHVG